MNFGSVGQFALKVLPDTAALYQTVADYLLGAAQAAVAARGRFHWVLAGGATPRGIHRQLLQRQTSGQPALPWEQTYVFWGDERAVPPAHVDSNFGMARESLLYAVPLSPRQIFRIEGELGADSAAERYEAKLRGYFQQQWPGFDLVMLGLGTDGHTASLFPEDDIVLGENERWVVATDAHNGHRRVTLTRPGLAGAGEVVFLVRGSPKASALARKFLCSSTSPAWSRMQRYIVRAWRSMPQEYLCCLV